MFRHLFLCGLVCSFILNLKAQDTADYKIYDSRLKKEVSLEMVTAKPAPGEILVFGEQHDDAVGHALELACLQALERRWGNAVILSMEMFHRDVQYIVDEYLDGLISEKNFVKEARAWESYSTDYKPSLEFAREKRLSVVAANTPSRYTNMVTRKGLEALQALGKDVKSRYLPPLPIDTLRGRYHEDFLKAMGGHTVPGMQLYQSQNLWDATMSWSISQAMKRNKKAVVLMLNGHFHSDYHQGMVKRLEDDYGKKVTTISCFNADDFDRPDWGRYADMADFVILTRKVKEEKNATGQ